MVNKLARGLLLIQGGMCVIYGIVVAFNMDAMAAYMGLGVLSGDGRAEILTMYFGMSGALGLFMLYAALSGQCLKNALLFMLITMLGITLGRLSGFLLFDTGEYILSSLAYDIPVLALTAWVYYGMFNKGETGGHDLSH